MRGFGSGAKVSTQEEDHERQHLVAGRSFLWNVTQKDQTQNL